MIRWSRRRYTRDQFIEAWNASSSIAECARLLNLIPAGGSYNQLKAAAADCGLSRDHMTGQAHGKSKSKKVYDLKDLLVDGVTYPSTLLKKRLLDEGIFEAKCSRCGGETHVGEPIPLHLDHINGVNTDNRLSNLRLLCPNCHALTDTYCGKNIKKVQVSRPVNKPSCSDCGCVVDYRSTRCRPCSDKHRFKRGSMV